jgi:tetratricopeptide (TPR) repeat protein
LGEFRGAAEQEQTARIEQAKVKAVKDAAELAERAEARAAAVKATFEAMANDPALRRKREAKDLRQRFGVGYIESEDYRRVMALLRQVANGQRLNVEDLAWLKTEADYCWTDELQRAWHTLEAAALTKAWESSGDPWNAVNASGHWRKAGEPERALRLTDAALERVGSNSKLRSALATTRGGAMRDLRRLDEAKALASEAHELTSSDYRPCTLLGAVHIELGDLPTGHEWYAKAETAWRRLRWPVERQL